MSTAETKATPKQIFSKHAARYPLTSDGLRALQADPAFQAEMAENHHSVALSGDGELLISGRPVEVVDHDGRPVRIEACPACGTRAATNDACDLCGPAAHESSS